MYAWTRFWHSGGAEIADEGGFLLDPTSLVSRFLHSQVLLPTSEIAKLPSVVLLGEAGSGKTTELHRIADEDLLLDLGEYANEQRLEAAIIDRLRAAAAKGSGAVVSLDSLDEALLGIPKAGAVISQRLRAAKHSGMRLRLSCRTGAWPGSLEALLNAGLGYKVQIFELAPLRKSDAAQAAEASKLDPQRFLEAVAERAAGPLASNPVTLKFLVDLFAGGNLPASRAELYELGLLQLCEQSEDRKERGSKPTHQGSAITAGQMLSLATRIAGVTVLSGKSVVLKKIPAATTPEGITVAAIAGGEEGNGANRVAVTEDAILAVLGHTGLFSSKGAGAFGFSHKSYAEFLAARFLNGSALSDRQLQSVLFSTEGGNSKLVPQLWETAAWLAVLQPAFGERIARTEPTVLLRSDLLGRTADFKSRLLDAILEALRDGRLHSLYDAVRGNGTDFSGSASAFIRQLHFPTIGDRLSPIIADRSAPRRLREAALEVVQDCGLVSLAALCAGVAVDAMEELNLRVSAARVVRQLDDDPSSLILKSLALTPGASDPQDDLRGNALRALWPRQLSVPELLGALTPPTRSSFFGAYSHFLADLTLPPVLSEDELIAGLRWAIPYVEHTGQRGALGRIASKLVFEGWRQAASAPIRAELSRVFNRRAQAHALLMFIPAATDDARSPEDRLLAELRSDTARRRLVLTDCIESMDPPKDVGRLAWGRPSIGQPEDFSWALERACGAADEVQAERYAQFARLLAAHPDTGPFKNADHLDLWLGAKAKSAVVARVLDWPTVVATDSLEADEARRDLAQEKAIEQELSEAQKERRTVSRKKLTQQFLRACEEKDVRYFARLLEIVALNQDLEYNWKLDVRVTPGWKRGSTKTRGRVVAAAKRYLLECPVTPPESGEPVVVDPDTAAAAAVLLWNIDRPWLDAIPESRIRELAPAFAEGLAHWSGSVTKVRTAVFRFVRRRARREVLRRVLSLVDAEKTNSYLPEAIRLLGRRIPARFLTRLLGDVQTSLLDQACFESLLTWLIQRDAKGALAFAQSLIPATKPSADVLVERAKAAARASLIISSPAAWKPVWAVIEGDPAWGDEILLTVAPGWGDSRAQRSDLHIGIGIAAAAALAELLFARFDPTKDPPPRQGFGYSVERENVREWRNGLVSYLASTGADDAIAVLRRIQERWPSPWLDQLVAQAELQRRRQTWVPTSPSALLEMRANRARRLVRTGEELLSLVNDAVVAWEKHIREKNLVESLWNEINKNLRIWQPKDEGHLCDVLASWLERELRDRHIAIGRELQISTRKVKDGQAGRRLDILVEAVSPAPDTPSIKVVVEVKGSWNKGAAVDYEQQLVNRYLQEYDARHGLFVVGWFDCPAWDKGDGRSTSGPWSKIEEARSVLDSQATSLNQNKPGIGVAAIVVDCHMA